jgi:predicted nuclease of predicted toxin-antitoxin system
VRLLADECCPKAIVERLRADGHDVLYAAETLHRSADAELLTLASAEGRIVITEDFDFGDLIVRDGLPAVGAIVMYLPKPTTAERAHRVAEALKAPGFDPSGALVVLEAGRLRIRKLGGPP